MALWYETTERASRLKTPRELCAARIQLAEEMLELARRDFCTTPTTHDLGQDMAQLEQALRNLRVCVDEFPEA